MALLRPADDPPARRGRRGDPAPAGPPAVGEPPPPSRHAHGGPRSPDDATSAPWSAVTAELARCADKFGLLSKPFQDSDQVSEGEAVAMLQACGFSAQDCTEIVRDMVAASPDHCTPSTMPTPISLFAESDKCGASGAHCAPTNDTAPMGMSSPLLPCSADTPGTALTPRLQLAFAEMSTMDMADRSAATTPVADDLGAACTTLPMPAVSAAHHSLLPPGPPLLHPATLCVPLGNAGLAASTNLGMVDSMDAMGRILVQDGAGHAESPADRVWKDGVFSIILQEYRATHGRDPPCILDGDLNSLLPPASPLPNPATKCVPLRKDGLAAGITLRWYLGWNGGPTAGTTLRWSAHSALCMAARGSLPDDILQQFLPVACLRNSRMFLLNSLASWGLTLCDLLSDLSLARARAFWDYDARLAGEHFDGRNTLAHAEDVLGFYVFGLACSCYLARTSAVPNISFRLGADLVAGVKALQCAKPQELPEYRACLLSVLAGFERVYGTMTASLDGDFQWAKPDDFWSVWRLWGPPREGSVLEEVQYQLRRQRVQDVDAVTAQLKALLAMAPGRRYRANKLPTHPHGLTLEGQLDLHGQPDRSRVPPLLPASTNKVLRWALFARWQDELELLQSLATSDGSWPDELLACPPSPPSASSAAPSLVASSSSEDDEDWGSPPSSPRVTPALVARLSAWIASSSQFPTSASV